MYIYVSIQRFIHIAPLSIYMYIDTCIYLYLPIYLSIREIVVSGAEGKCLPLALREYSMCNVILNK